MILFVRTLAGAAARLTAAFRPRRRGRMALPGWAAQVEPVKRPTLPN